MQEEIKELAGKLCRTDNPHCNAVCTCVKIERYYLGLAESAVKAGYRKSILSSALEKKIEEIIGDVIDSSAPREVIVTEATKQLLSLLSQEDDWSSYKEKIARAYMNGAKAQLAHDKETRG